MSAPQKEKDGPRGLGAEGRATLARLSASVEAALACLMAYEGQQRACAADRGAGADRQVAEDTKARRPSKS